EMWLERWLKFGGFITSAPRDRVIPEEWWLQRNGGFRGMVSCPDYHENCILQRETC
ncbi:hypothetical protein J6590_053178, partial [Homalodisca vitripennis]